MSSLQPAHDGVSVDAMAAAAQEGIDGLCSANYRHSRSVTQDVGGEAWTYQEPVAVFIDGRLLMGGVGELLSWAADTYCYQDNL